MIRRILISCVAIGFYLHAAQAVPETPPWKMIVQWDNDLLAGTDRDYTNGVRVAFTREFAPGETVHNFLQQSLYSLSGADTDSLFHDWRFSGAEPDRFAWGFGLTQLMFTPVNPSALTPSDGERPYAGWLGLEFSLHAKNNDSVSSATISLGTTGKNSFARESQEWVHHNISGSPIFQGWKSQVPGEFTLNLYFDHKRWLNLLEQTKEWPIEFDGYVEWGTSLGNFRTDAYVGSLLRAGYNLPATFSTPRIQIGSYGHELFRPIEPEEAPFSLLGFVGVRGSAVLHDVTLDGPVFSEFDTGVDSKPFVGELLFGVSLRYDSCVLSLSRTIRSDEFYGQSENQEFGSVMLRVTLPF